MDKRTIIALVLSFVVIFGWTYVVVPLFTPEQPAYDNSSSKIPQAPVTSSIDNASVDNVSIIQSPVSAPVQASNAEDLTTEKTKIMEVTFNTATGDIRSVALPQWKDTEGEFVTFNKNGSSD